MMPLTEKQKRLAETNHNLVYEFLNANNLSESQYYDVIIFGYLCAAQEYCENPKLQKYSFATIAWRQMNQELFKHRRYLDRKKRDFTTISLSELLGNSDESRSVEDVIATENALLEDLKLNLMLHALASEVTQRQMRIIHMKLNGYRMHDIAKKEKMTFSDINGQLDGVRNVILKIIEY